MIQYFEYSEYVEYVQSVQLGKIGNTMKISIEQLTQQRFNELKEHFDKEGVEWMPFGPKIELERIRNEIEAELDTGSIVDQLKKSKQKYMKINDTYYHQQ